VLTIAGRDANGILNGHLADLAPELRGRIRVVGHVSGVAKAAILASHELFVLPSDNENFGIAAVEAAYAGLRVITTMEVASGVLLAARSLATLLPGTEATTISRTILDELRRPWLSDERETRASAAKRLFSWDATARQLLLVYERLTP
jgi:glycosyltransferase involved in cell wall biosynthesis